MYLPSGYYYLGLRDMRQPLGLGGWKSQVKSSQLLLPKYTEQDAKPGPSSQFAERAGSGLQAVLQAAMGCVGCVYVRRCAY